jgi:cell division inhibitor SepF
MNGFMEGFKRILLGNQNFGDENENYDDFDDDLNDNYTEYKSKPEPTTINQRDRRPTIEGGSNIVNFRNPYTGKQTEMVLANPKNMEGAASVCTDVRDNKACIVNLNGLDHDLAQRIADFISGAIYSVEGDIQRISDDIFIAAPQSVHITSDVKKEIKKSGGSFFQWAANNI